MTLNTQKLNTELLQFMQEAGDFAMSKWGHTDNHLKGDRSIVTETDLYISDLAASKFSSYFNSDEHVLIDEETASESEGPEKLYNQGKYHWVIDPIDGTCPYAWGRDQFAISIGITKNLKPWLGGAYFPAMNLLFWDDGETAVWITNPFSDKAKTTQVAPISIDVTHQTPFDMCQVTTQKYIWDTSVACPATLLSAVVSLGYLIQGKSCGYFIAPCPWDIVGLWPLLSKAGFSIFDIETDEEVIQLDASHLKTNWRYKNCLFICHKENYKKLKAGLKLRNVSMKVAS